jgi:hypothetical protein
MGSCTGVSSSTFCRTPHPILGVPQATLSVCRCSGANQLSTPQLPRRSSCGRKVALACLSSMLPCARCNLDNRRVVQPTVPPPTLQTTTLPTTTLPPRLSALSLAFELLPDALILPHATAQIHRLAAPSAPSCCGVLPDSRSAVGTLGSGPRRLRSLTARRRLRSQLGKLDVSHTLCFGSMRPHPHIYIVLSPPYAHAISCFTSDSPSSTCCLMSRTPLTLATCYWLLAAGCWLLAADCWLLAADR